MLNKKQTNQLPAAFPEKQPVSLFILISLLVVLVHLTAIRWLGSLQNMSTNNVSNRGASEGVQVLRSSGHKMLDEAATKALKKWRFSLGKQGNTAVVS